MNHLVPGLALVLALSGCMAGLRGEPVQRYDLGTPVTAARPLERFALKVGAPPWLDGTAIRYRLAYAGEDRVATYTLARWDAPAVQLLGRRLAGSLGVALSPGGSGVCTLRIDVREMAQVFESPQRSFALLDVEASLVATGGEVLARHPWSIRQPAAGADAAGGVAALRGATDELATRLAGWLAPQATSAPCAAPPPR